MGTAGKTAIFMIVAGARNGVFRLGAVCALSGCPLGGKFARSTMETVIGSQRTVGWLECARGTVHTHITARRRGIAASWANECEAANLTQLSQTHADSGWLQNSGLGQASEHDLAVGVVGCETSGKHVS